MSKNPSEDFHTLIQDAIEKAMLGGLTFWEAAGILEYYKFTLFLAKAENIKEENQKHP